MMLLRKLKQSYFLNSYRYLNLRQSMATKVDDGSREFKVPVPWGHIAGKEWGPPNGQKVLAVHGWQDNAGTFDTLVPLLDSLHIYSIDLPGHGRSSHIIAGVPDGFSDKLCAIHRVVRYFGLSNFIYLGHSYGAAIGYLYSAIFPEMVSGYISLDVLKPLIRTTEKPQKRLRFCIESLIDLDDKVGSAPPSYSLEEILNKAIEGTRNSLTLESARILAQRGLNQTSDGGYYFSRDLKVKLPPFNLGITNEVLTKYAEEIKCPVLFIRTSEAEKVVIAPVTYFNEEMEILKSREAPFVYEEVEGTHHVHLNNPERIAPIINKFVASLK